MKNFLIFLLGLLINAVCMYVLFPIVFVGLTACLWAPLLFKFEGAVVGAVITILTLAVIIFVDYKLDNY